MVMKSAFGSTTEPERKAIGRRIGEMVSQFRTQAAAADCAELSVDQLMRIVAGLSAPTALPITRLAKATGYRLDWVMTGIGEKVGGTVKWPTFDDAAGRVDAEAAGTALEQASEASHGGVRVAVLSIYLQHTLRPRLAKLYDQAGKTLSERYLQDACIQAAVLIGEGEPEGPRFQPIPHWPLVVEAIIRAHTQAVTWLVSNEKR